MSQRKPDIRDQEARSIIADLRASLETLEKRFAELEEEKSGLESSLEENINDLTNAQYTIESLEEDVSEKDTKIAQLEEAVADAYLTDSTPE